MRHLSLLALLSLPCVSAGPASPPPPPDTPFRFAHASLAAYPNAVISLRDPDTGMTFYVESDGRRLVTLDRDGRLAWGVDLLENIEIPPRMGNPVIRRIVLREGKLWAVAGKSDTIQIDPLTGKATHMGGG
jgi:hypothetical protein